MRLFQINILVALVIIGQNLSPAPVLAATETVTINSHASISETLELTVAGQTGSQLKFDIKSGSNTPQAQLAVNVNSNTGNPYQVTQQLQNALQNSSGDEIDSSNIKFTSSGQKSGGTSVTNSTALGSSSQIIYSSDAQGTSNTVIINYSVEAPATQAPGDYSGSITFTAASI